MREALVSVARAFYFVLTAMSAKTQKKDVGRVWSTC
jgi:hypothetical protein